MANFWCMGFSTMEKRCAIKGSTNAEKRKFFDHRFWPGGAKNRAFDVFLGFSDFVGKRHIFNFFYI